jgi:prepilin-type processing-associated H-X9-DG protein
VKTFHSGNVRTQPNKSNPGPVSPRSLEGLTRLELLGILTALALLAAVAVPALAANRDRSQRVICLSNLRSIGQAFQQWGTEHFNQIPWRTPLCEGGTMPINECPGPQPSWVTTGLNQNIWFQYFWISNELRTPKVLTCPSDPQKRTANTWLNNSVDGFMHPSGLNNSVSYLIGLDVFAQDINGLVAGDRNVRFSSLSGGSCSSTIRYNGALTFGNGPASFGIDSRLHGEAGNYLFSDGSVEELSSAGFARRMTQAYGGQDNATAHYLTP